MDKLIFSLSFTSPYQMKKEKLNLKFEIFLFRSNLFSDSGNLVGGFLHLLLNLWILDLIGIMFISILLFVNTTICWALKIARQDDY